MSFLSDLAHGNFGNLGHDLAPSNVFSDFGADTKKALSNPWVDVGIAAGLGALTLGAGDLLGAALLPTASEGIVGAAAGEAAVPSLGAAFGGIDAAAAGAGDVLSGGNTALPYAAPDIGAGAPGAVPGGDSGLGAINTSLATAPTPTPTASLASAAAGPGDLSTIGPGALAPPTDLTPPPAAAAPGAAAPGAAAPAAATPGSPGLFPSLQPTGFVGATLKEVAPIAGLGGLGYNLYSGYQQKKQLAQTAQAEASAASAANATANQERAIAQPLFGEGTNLMTYISSGTLPPQFQSQVDQIVASQKAKIIQGYASRGMSSDPRQNSALAQDLNNVDAQALTLKTNTEATLATAGNGMVQQANQLLNSGMTATQLAAELPILMQKLESELNTQASQALSLFANAAGGGTGTGQSVKVSLTG